MQAASMTVNDGTATPVAITFVPESVTPGLTSFVDRRKGARSLQPSITSGFSAPSSKRPTARANFGVTYPIEGVVNGVAAPVSVARFNSDAVIPESMLIVDRKHLHAFVVNGLSNALWKAMFVDLDPIY